MVNITDSEADSLKQLLETLLNADWLHGNAPLYEDETKENIHCSLCTASWAWDINAEPQPRKHDHVCPVYLAYELEEVLKRLWEKD